MATAQLTRAMGGLSVSGSRRPSTPAAPGFGFCACMRGQSLIGAHLGSIAGGALRCLLLSCLGERPSLHQLSPMLALSSSGLTRRQA